MYVYVCMYDYVCMFMYVCMYLCLCVQWRIQGGGLWGIKTPPPSDSRVVTETCENTCKMC